MPSARPLLGTTNEGLTLGFHSGNLDSVLEEHHQNGNLDIILEEHHQNAVNKCCHHLLPRPLLRNIKHPTHRKKHVSPVFIATNTPLRYYKPPIAATMSIP
jgi:hypothetical protein